MLYNEWEVEVSSLEIILFLQLSNKLIIFIIHQKSPFCIALLLLSQFKELDLFPQNLTLPLFSSPTSYSPQRIDESVQAHAQATR